MKTPVLKSFGPQFLDQNIISSILIKIEGNPSIKNPEVISLPRLFACLDKKEISFIKKFLLLNPATYGFKGKFLGFVDVPKNLIAVKRQTYIFRRKKEIIATQFVPKPVHNAYKDMDRVLRKETGKKLLVTSGYRSPAYQVIIFLHYLEFYDFDFLKTIKRVAFPGYSEHGVPHRQALDFITANGSPSSEKPLAFKNTKEYRWLVKNAQQFGFLLSYPKINKDGIMYEPWHWHFEKDI